MADYRRYSVRAGASGRMAVDVPLGAIKLRGERNAVLSYAWSKLLGEEDIFGRVNHNSKTREFIMTETQSRYSAHRDQVFETFCSRVSYAPMHNVLK